MNQFAQFAADVRHVPFGQLLKNSLGTNPNDTAFRHDGQSLSRSEILTLADTLATDLHRAGLQQGQAVIVDLPHGLALAIAMLAVPIAGGCAVPLDAALPQTRRDAIQADVNAEFSLALAKPEDKLPTIRQNTNHDSRQDHDPDLLFLVYTSGSSGGPKGVKISNTNYVSRMVQIVPPERQDPPGVDLCWTPASFIGMLDEIYFPILCNKPSVIASPDIRVDLRKFADLIARENVTAFRTTPSLLNVLLEADLGARFQSVTDIYMSGEAVTPRLLQRAQTELDAQVWCFYGATEAPGIAYFKAPQTGASMSPTAYTPQPFVAFRVTNSDGSQVTGDETGEICVGGDVVSSGYWKNANLTDEKFYFDDKTWWYRTGDQGRLQTDGSLQILGRLDLSECKINGVRISLDEIRAAIMTVPGVKAAWVSVLEPENDAQQIRLVGHMQVDPNAPMDPSEASDMLDKALPLPARLSALVRHDNFPLTANGKLDIQALLAQSDRHLERATDRPVTDAIDAKDIRPEVLKLVLDLAEQTLGRTGLKASDNFFRSGGNSLAAVQLAVKLGNRLGPEFSPALVFNADTFADIAHSVQHNAQRATSVLRLLRKGTSDQRRVFTINSTANYAKLAPHMAQDLNVHNLNIYGLSLALNDRLDRFSLDEVAEHFADALIATNPKGPWPLIAYCQDGCLAVETARILKKRTGITAHLLMIDTFFSDHRKTLKMYIRNSADFGIGWAFSRLAGRLGVGPNVRTLAVERNAEIAKSRKKIELDNQLNARFRELFMSYQPEPLDTPVLLFVSREWRHVNLNAARNMAGPSLETREINGDHDHLFRDDCLAYLADVLSKELETIGTTQNHIGK